MVRDVSTSPILQDYDTLVEQLHSRLEAYERRHEELGKDFLTILNENRELEKRLGEEFRHKIQDGIEEGKTRVLEAEAVLNLRKQLELSLGEKERAWQLYSTSTKLVEKLEAEKTLRSEEREKHEVKMKLLESKLESRQLELDVANADRRDLEKDMRRYQEEVEELKLKLTVCDEVMKNVNEREEELKERYRGVEQELVMMSATFGCVRRSRDELEDVVDVRSTRIKELERSMEEAKNKVEEALDIVEKAMAERGRALDRVQELEEEVGRLQLCVDHVIEEAGRKTSQEVEAARRESESSLQDVKDKLQNCERDLQVKTHKLKQITARYEKLEKTIASKIDKEKIKLIRGSETEIGILENQLDSAHYELETVKRKYDEETTERQRLEQNLRGLRISYDDLSSEKTSDAVRFEEELRSLKRDFERKLADLTDRSSTFEKKIYQLQVELQGEREELNKCICDELKGKLERAEELRAEQVSELVRQIESYMQLEDKWKKRVKETIEKFELKLLEAKDQKKRAKTRNKRLRSELSDTQGRMTVLYQQSQQMMS